MGLPRRLRVIAVDELQALLEEFLAAPVSNLTRLPGGASRETWSFAAGGRRLVLRRDPPRHESMSTDRKTEFELLRRAAAAGVPVPPVLEMCELGSPGFLMEFVEGETIARKILRDDEYAAARPVMASQCGEILARLHSIEATDLLGPPPAAPAAGALDRYRSVLDSFGEPHPAFELGFRWLEGRLPAAGRAGLVHGDFRLGNLIVDASGVRAVLDWELAHIGDPWEDLGWLCVRSWRFGGPGEVGGFGRRDDLYSAYERASGVPVDTDAVWWWEVFGTLKWGVICIAQAFTHLWGRVQSVELAAIGRRAVETEYDLLELIS